MANKMANKEIRNEIAGAGLKMWQIAQQLKVSESTFTRLMRVELSNEKKTEIRAIIEELKGGDE